MIFWELEITFEEDFHSGSGKEGATLDIVRNSHDRAIIPASTIKGIIRQEVERILLAKGMKDPCNITDRLEGETLDCPGICPSCIIFGRPSLESKEFKEGKLRITDLVEVGGSKHTIRPHVRIDRGRGKHAAGALFFEKAVPRGTKFRGFLIARLPMTKEEMDFWKAGLWSASHYGIGSGRSRGMGLIRFDVKEVEREEFKKKMLEMARRGLAL